MHFDSRKNLKKNLSNLRVYKRKTNNVSNQRKHIDRAFRRGNSFRFKEKRQSNNFERIWREDVNKTDREERSRWENRALSVGFRRRGARGGLKKRTR